MQYHLRRDMENSFDFDINDALRVLQTNEPAPMAEQFQLEDFLTNTNKISPNQNDLNDFNKEINSMNESEVFDLTNSSTTPYANSKKISKNTLLLRQSHIYTIQNYGYDPKTMTKEEFKEFCTRIKADRNIKDSYLATIITTIRAINPTINISAKQLNLKRKNIPQILKLQETSAIESLITNSIEYIRSGIYNESKLNSETKLAIIMTFMTNLRISELLQLTIQDLNRIKNQERITIKVKRQFEPVSIIKFGKLFDDIYPSIIKYINYRNSQFNSNKLISISSSAINANIKRILSPSMRDHIKIGLRLIRIYTTTKLIDNNNIGLSQIINRHANQNVTLDNYNMPMYEDDE